MSISGEIVSTEQFFAPVSADLIDGLIGQYQSERTKIEHVAEFMATEVGEVFNYFVNGNRGGENWYGHERLFQRAGAVSSLNAFYWQKALNMTDVIDCMPQKRRDEWFSLIREMKTPDFEEETVRATMAELLLSREKFFSERVDGIFRALSGTHVTNAPEGFGKRMILADVIQSYGTVNHSKSGYINDLRAVVAKFMGRDQPDYGASDKMLYAARRNPGQWMLIDGGAMRIRVYNGVGTAHLEVHPDMAWRLNCILASLYPTAIPPKFRQKPKKQPKDFFMMDRPLPFAVASALAGLKEAFEFVDVGRGECGRERKYLKNTLCAYSHDGEKLISEEVDRVLTMIGGVKMTSGVAYKYFQFDYDPSSVIDEIVCSGCIPDQKSHQFYPTPEKLAQIAVELADIQDGHVCLEPSAGVGGLADLMPKLQTICVEISPLHCKVLEAKGFSVECMDFMKFGIGTAGMYDRIVMNPPFSEGRWHAHLQHAASLLGDGGKLVAILPASAKGKDDLLPSLQCTWSQVYSNEFAGTSVSVVILLAQK